MVYDENLAARIRAALAARRRVVEKKMFGGITFMIDGKMACGVLKDDFIAKLDRARWDEALARPHARPMDFTGKPMPGMVYVAPAGVRTEGMLRRWVEECAEFAAESAREGGKRKTKTTTKAKAKAKKTATTTTKRTAKKKGTRAKKGRSG